LVWASDGKTASVAGKTRQNAANRIRFSMGPFKQSIRAANWFKFL